MKSLAYAVFAAALCLGALGFVGLGFWRVAQETKEDLGVLVPQLDALIASWQARGVPANARAVIIVLGDASAQGDFLSESPLPTRGERLAAWLKSAYGAKTPPAPIDSMFVKAFSADPNVIAWTYEGLPPAAQARMVRELKKTIEKANDAGAELDVIVQGRAVVPVFKALKSVQGETSGGTPAGVNKLLAVGGNTVRFQRMDSTLFASFAKPENVFEWINFWQDNVAGTRRTQFEMHTRAGVDGWAIRDVYPRWEGQDSDVAAAVKELIASPLDVSEQLKRKAAAVQAAERAAKLAAAGRLPQDSLEMVQDRAIAPAAPARAPAHPAISPGGTPDWEARCVRCCAAVGGRWDTSSRYSGYHYCADHRPLKGQYWLGIPACESERANCLMYSIADWEKACAPCCAEHGGKWERAGAAETEGRCCRGTDYHGECLTHFDRDGVSCGSYQDHPFLCPK